MPIHTENKMFVGIYIYDVYMHINNMHICACHVGLYLVTPLELLVICQTEQARPITDLLFSRPTLLYFHMPLS